MAKTRDTSLITDNDLSAHVWTSRRTYTHWNDVQQKINKHTHALITLTTNIFTQLWKKNKKNDNNASSNLFLIV